MATVPSVISRSEKGNRLYHSCGIGIVREIPNPQEAQVQSAHVLVDGMRLFSSCTVWVGKPWRMVKPGVRHAGVIHAAFYEGKTQRNRLLMAWSWQPRLFCCQSLGDLSPLSSRPEGIGHSAWLLLWNPVIHDGETEEEMLACVLSLAGLNTRVLFLPLCRSQGYLPIWGPDTHQRTEQKQLFLSLVLRSLLHTPCALLALLTLALPCRLVVPPCPWPLLCFLTSVFGLWLQGKPWKGLEGSFLHFISLKMSTNYVEKWNLWNWM